MAFISDTDSFYTLLKNVTYDEALDKLKPHIDFSNFPPDHPRFCAERKAELGYVKVDTAEQVIHSVLAEKKKSYQLYTDKSVSYVAHTTKLLRKDVKKGCPKRTAKKISNRRILALKKEPGLIKVDFKKLQAKRHKISMVNTTKTVSNSFDDSSYYRTCGLCNIPFNCTLSDIGNCKSLDCKVNQLLINIWSRLEEEKG